MLALLALGLVAVGAGWSATSEPRLSCAPFDALHVRSGDYIYQQDEWNSTRVQCASVVDTSFVLTKASFNLPTNGPPATYPSFFRGCHWGMCTNSATSLMPIQVSKIKSIRSTWQTRQPKAGAYDVAYDIWTNKRSATGGQPNGSETMIWLNSRGKVQPFGSRVGTTTLAGARWAVWFGRASDWNVVSYRRLEGTTGVRDLDVKAFLADGVKRGYTKPAWYVISGEAGFEIWQGGKALATTAFSFDVQ
jgi:hypothetical protein